LSGTINDFRQAVIYSTVKPKLKKLTVQDNGQSQEVKLFVEGVKNGYPSPISLEEIKRGMETCFAIEDSIRSGKTITLS
jgi:hypothetical protein